MIDLKTLSREERTLLTIRCEPFYIGFTENKVLSKVHSKLMENFHPNHKKEVWVFLTACSQALRYGSDGSMFSLRKENYTSANKRNGSNISYVKCKRVVETLDKMGLIVLCRGFYDHYSQTSAKSCFIMNKELIGMFDQTNLKRFGNPRPVSSYVELRDSVTKELILDMHKLRSLSHKKELVRRYNEFLLLFDIRCKGHKVCTVYKRVFTDDVDQHGRWYSMSTFQTARSYLRQYITIDAIKTTEIDFRQMHPRLLLSLSGVYKPMSWEPYVDIQDLVGGEEGASRKLSKDALMCLINAESESKARSAFCKGFLDDCEKEYKERRYKGCNISNKVDMIFMRLKMHNHEIAHWFGKEKLWAMLQHYDSSIAEIILEKFMLLGKCCLPWHDSFVVEIGDRDLLIETMRDAWKQVLGDDKNCFYDIEF